MTKPHSLTINWDGENSVPQILPQPPCSSSKQTGIRFSSITFINPLLKQSIPAPCSHCPNESAAWVERKLDEVLFLLPACNHFSLVPAGVSFSLDSQRCRYLNLSLEPDLIHISAAELVNTESIELIPNTAYADDPLLPPFCKSQLELGGNGSRLYVESAANLIAAHLLHYSTHQLSSGYSDGLSQSKLARWWSTLINTSQLIYRSTSPNRSG